MAKLRTLQARVNRAEKELRDAIRERFTKGLVVHLQTSSPFDCELVVWDTSYNRVHVCNERTEKDYWLYASRLREFNTL